MGVLGVLKTPIPNAPRMQLIATSSFLQDVSF